MKQINIYRTEPESMGDSDRPDNLDSERVCTPTEPDKTYHRDGPVKKLVSHNAEGQLIRG
jgi:hypothetical protein